MQKPLGGHGLNFENISGPENGQNWQKTCLPGKLDFPSLNAVFRDIEVV